MGVKNMTKKDCLHRKTLKLQIYTALSVRQQMKASGWGCYGGSLSVYVWQYMQYTYTHRDSATRFLLKVLFKNQFPPSPWVSY
jgi:hypothetical protein